MKSFKILLPLFCALIGTLLSQPIEPLQKQLEEVQEQLTSFDAPATQELLSSDQVLATDTTTMLVNTLPEEKSVFRIDIKHAFYGSPIIYSILACMSLFSFSIWAYSMFCLRKEMKAPASLLTEVKNKLIVNHYDDALRLLESKPYVVNKMLSSLIEMRKFGMTTMLEGMRTEGKRATVNYWQKLGLLSDIAIMAPMFGLLGTVLGMFYAFYDINRSIESITTLFDGLGISVGTTVAGLIVALFAMMFHSLAKFRLIKALAQVENEAARFVPIISDQESSKN